MYLESIELNNFRGIRDLSINFGPKVNIIVGINGAGKTSVLDSCSIIFSDFINKTTKSKNELKFKDQDIYNLESSSIIKATFGGDDILGFEKNIILHKTRAGIVSLEKDETIMFRKLSENIIDGINKNTIQSIPIFAYYQAHRALLDIPLRIRKTHKFSLLEAYDQSLNGDANFRLFFEWFREQEDLENENLSNIEIENELDKAENSLELLTKVTSLFEQLNNVERIIDNNDVNSLKNEIEYLKNEVGGVRSELEQAQEKLKVAIEDSGEYKKSLNYKKIKFVRDALIRFIPYVTDFRIKRNPLSMVAKKNGIDINIDQLSQGEKILIAMIGDIARRLVIANPTLNNPLEGEGIILIDEIELHLHPKWQSEIVKNLTNVFPNCQFILTTHSPQVIREIEKESVSLLSVDEKQNAMIIKPIRTIGLDSSDILSEVMDVPTINKEFENKLSELYKLVDDNKYSEAHSFLNELQKKYSDVPELIKARCFIEFMEE